MEIGILADVATVQVYWLRVRLRLHVHLSGLTYRISFYQSWLSYLPTIPLSNPSDA